MSIVPMVRQCIHCHRWYHYNISVGNFGMVCPYCRRSQLSVPVLKRLHKIHGR